MGIPRLERNKFSEAEENSVSRLSTFPAIPNPIHPIRQRKDAELPGLGIVILAFSPKPNC
jgi:hypothetical protein